MSEASKLAFIVGRGRSGSTLLVQCLDAHPRIAMAPEAPFVVSLFRRYRRARWDDRTVRRFCRDLWREDRLRRWSLDREGLERRLLAGHAGRDYAAVCAEVYAASARGRGKAGALVLGDKNPLYPLFVRPLMELFPRARFVHLVRDYRDNVLSYRGVPFDASSVPVLAVRWRLYNESILAAAASAPDRFLRVRFEDLIAAPEPSLRRICEFLGVEWAASMLTDRAIPSYGLLDWHRKIAGPVDPGQAGKWRTALAPEAIALADRVCQPLGATFGYLPSVSTPPRPGPGAHLAMLAGHALTLGERALMRAPLRLRTAVVRAYRRATGNMIR